MSAAERDLLAKLASLLDLGPFGPETPRHEKWRTTEQLAHGLIERWGQHESLDHLQQVLEEHEAEARTRLDRGQEPDARIRRATYPDRTTALTLWGSTEHLGQPWPKQAQPRRMDPPEDLPAALRLATPGNHIFLSHACLDRALAMAIASELAAMGWASWMFETHIEHHGRIADCVREALGAAAHCVAGPIPLAPFGDLAHKLNLAKASI
jgi:hypothetical protein